jgi:hypothetical protein
MSNLVKYLIVDLETGKWDWNNEPEHHSIAVPKMLNSLDLRVDKVLNDIAECIQEGMKDTVYNRKLKTRSLFEKIKAAKEEFYLHYYMLSDFKRKVITNIEEKKVSPIMSLKLMDSPLNRKHKTGMTHIYEHFDNTEIEVKLDAFQDKLDDSIDTIDITLDVWDEMLNLYDENDPFSLLNNIKSVNGKLKGCKDEKIRSSFFAIDDATKGLIKQNIKVKVDLDDSLNKISDLIMRTFVKCIDTYKNNSNNKNNNDLIEKAFDRLKQMKLYEDALILSQLRTVLETEAIRLSYETCYKKIGEMHANMHLKIFEIGGLKHLRKYFAEENVFLVDVTLNEFERVHKMFLNDEKVDIHSDKKMIERNLSELEIYTTVIEDLLIDCEPGKAYFYLNSKLHTINSFIASKYYVLDYEDCLKNLDVIGSDLFRNFISTLSALMFALRKELTIKQEVVDLQDLTKVGLRTGKTTMIDSYEKALEVILASLGTFMANTLHVLIKEILQNLTENRTNIFKTYNEVEFVLREFNRE